MEYKQEFWLRPPDAIQIRMRVGGRDIINYQPWRAVSYLTTLIMTTLCHTPALVVETQHSPGKRVAEPGKSPFNIE
jgi:hypothetical protein